MPYGHGSNRWSESGGRVGECVRRVESSLLISHACGLPHLGHGRVRKSLSRELQFGYIY